MTRTVSIDGQDVNLATITVGALETIELGGLRGRKFNIALVAASILSTGDTERGNVAWVATLPIFSPDEEQPAFLRLVDAANEVNGFKSPKPGETEPAAPAAE